MTRAIVICFVLFAAGHLAAASKSFGSGGYGEEGAQAQAQAQEVVQIAARQAAAASTAPLDESYGTLTPTTTTAEASSSSSSASNSPATAGQQEEGYGSSAGSDEPLNGLNDKAINDILNEHNIFRAKEHVPPLVWNTTLAKFSQDYAEKKLKKECKMVHSSSPYGENLMMGSGAISWKTTVDTWSDEKKSYHYGANTCDPGKMCGHYTAVVWKDTTSVGCGRVLCDDNKETMIMCSYWPPGNYENQRPF